MVDSLQIHLDLQSAVNFQGIQSCKNIAKFPDLSGVRSVIDENHAVVNCISSKQPPLRGDSAVKKILILAANPKNTDRLRLDQEVREIDEGLRRSRHREQFELTSKWAVRLRDFYYGRSRKPSSFS
jgi:hypothetical protein